ncbi:MAG: DUF1540 domain-containing protein [Oscillospiraceae bacterium]|nr:DUF1540 domain-containing protein [Oscillospiraceae bacterium]
MNQNENTIQGICCEVDTCKYNDGHCCCTAHNITVKNRMALMGEETMCDTFEEEE